MGEVMEEWIRLSASIKAARTITTYRVMRRAYLEGVGDHPLRDFGMLHVDRYTTWLQQQGLEPATLNIRLHTLNTFLNWAVERELLEKKPRVRQLRATKKLPKVLSPEDVDALMAHVTKLRESHPNRRQRAYYRLHERFLRVARYTGARLSEVFWLKWEQIDLEASVIRVEKQGQFNVKERREKILPIPQRLRDYLAAERAASPGETYLLDDGVGALAYTSPYALTRVFQRHFQHLGFSKRGIKPVHGLRAFFAGELRNTLGLDIHTVKTWLGHSNISVTEGYFPDPDGLLREGVKRYDEAGRG